MNTIKYKDLKQLLIEFNDTSLLIKQDSIVITEFNIKKSKLFIDNDMLIIQDESIKIMEIKISWVYNYYISNDSNIIKLEFDQIGEILIIKK